MEKQERVYNLILDYVNENIDNDNDNDNNILSSLVSSCNMYDSGLEDYYFWYHDNEFYECMFETKDEVARAIYYASNYNYTDEYIKLNVYGNCETMNEYEYNDMLIENEEEIVEEYVNGLFEDFNWFIGEISDNELIDKIKEIMESESKE